MVSRRLRRLEHEVEKARENYVEKALGCNVTIHKSQDSVRSSVFKSQFGRFFGTAGLKETKHTFIFIIKLWFPEETMSTMNTKRYVITAITQFTD